MVRIMKKRAIRIAFTGFICLILSFGIIGLPVSADVDYPLDAAYNTYIYDCYGFPVSIASPFTVERVVKGTDISDQAFANLSDIYYNDGRLYICDTENHRVLITDTDFHIIATIAQFTLDGAEESLNLPRGVWADGSDVYVADTGNQRIVRFSVEGTAVTAKRVFDRPDIALLGEDYVYTPIRLTVDATGKLYVIAAGVNQGVVCLDENGVFQSFLGAPQVEPNFLETLWRRMATKEQLKRMESYVPTEYNAITMDSYGFLYVASQTSNSVPVGKLNSDGKNVLAAPKLKGYGDLPYLSPQTYAPYFADVALYDSQRIGEDFYFVIDSKRGQIFAYTEDGYLLYAFGRNGEQAGTFYNATAIEYIPAGKDGCGRLLVTDGFKGTVTVLKETAFSVSIRSALRSYYLGEYDKAQSQWTAVKTSCSNYRLADIGLAKIELHNKQYLQAMSRLMSIREHDLYADAFEGWRNDFIRDHFTLLLGLLLGALIAVIVIVKVLKKENVFRKLKESALFRAYQYGSYVMLHPFDGFWDLKHEKRGNVKSATLIGVLFLLIWGLRAQFGGYVVTYTVPSEVNALYEMLMIFLPLTFYVAANWCFTTLMDGKGTLKDIYIATCYALKPYVIFGIPMLILSNVLAGSESAFYTFFDIVLLIWVVFLLFAGLMMTHDYSLGKTMLSVILILIGICLIVFVILLIFSIVQNVYQFVYNCYQELSFRMY